MTAPFGGLPLPAGLELFEVETPAGALTAFEARPEAPARGLALFVPGFTGSKEDHRFLVADAARRGWHAASVSNRGQADSAAPSGAENYTLRAFAADVLAVARTLLDRDVASEIQDSARPERLHLVGHSLGGLIARAAVVASPEFFESLTLLCSGPAGRAGRHQAEADYVAAHGTLALWDRDNPRGATTVDERFVRDRMAATSDDNFVGGNAVLQSAPDITAELVATGVRALVAHGDADDAWPIDGQRDMAERMGAEYAVIPAAGHLPNVENPTYTARLLSDFWAGDKGDE